MNTLLARLKEPSTYRGLTLLGAVVGINISPDLAGAIASTAAGVIAFIEIFRKERPKN
jgi:hypothetical protein